MPFFCILLFFLIMDEALFFNVLRFLMVVVCLWFVWKSLGVFRGLAHGDKPADSSPPKEENPNKPS